MPFGIRFGLGLLLMNAAWLGLLVPTFLSFTNGREPELTDTNTLRLLRRGIDKHLILIEQASPLQKLTASVEKFEKLNRADFVQIPPQSLVLDAQQWDRVERLVNRFVAAANQNRGAAFVYATLTDGTTYATDVLPTLFEYRNPFERVGATDRDAPMISSQTVDSQRHGWRVIGRDLALYLSPRTVHDEVTVNFEDAVGRGAFYAARHVVLRSSSGHAIRLSSGSAALAPDRRSGATGRLVVERLDAQGSPVGRPTSLDSGGFFVFGGQAFAVYSTQHSEAGVSGTPLLLSKLVNGSVQRVHLLGEATTNLLGLRAGEYPRSLDGLLADKDVTQLDLTLDPDLQVGAYLLLRRALEPVDARFALGRPRRGSVTILDLETGAILAQVGYPSYDPNLTFERRRKWIGKARIRQNPSFEVHMPGSAIKVLTVATGYLLAGDSRAELLPKSLNNLAVYQAFQNAFAAPLNVTLDLKAEVTPAAEKRFREVGTPQRVKPVFLQVLQQVFRVSPVIPERQTGADDPRVVADLREDLIPPNLAAFFLPRPKVEEAVESANGDDTQTGDEGDNQEPMDVPSLLWSQFTPQTSRFPVLRAGSMHTFRNYSIGGQDARFTTLRLASILSIVASGRIAKPYIIESVTVGHGGGVRKAQPPAPTVIDFPWLDDVERRRIRMTAGTTSKLREVLLPGGTGKFESPRLNGSWHDQYLAQDDPLTTDFDEHQSRLSDYGKSGTADYGKMKKFNDSAFVYRHGRYVTAVWLEQADPPGSEEGPQYQHPAHRLTHYIVQMIEALEGGRNAP